MLDRRDFLKGIIASACAPAFIKTAGLLMPIKPIIWTPDATEWFAVDYYGSKYIFTTEIYLAA